MSKEAMKLQAIYETIIQWDEGGGKRSRRELARRIVALAEQPAQQPDYWLGYGLQAHTEKPFEGATPVWESPPAQRTWVGLTDEDVRQCSRDVVAGGSENSVDRFAYAIEAKLKAKNSP